MRLCETLNFEEALKNFSKATENFYSEYGKPFNNFNERFLEEKERIKKEARISEISFGYKKLIGIFIKEPTSFIKKYQKDILDNKIVFIVHFSPP